MAARCEIPYKEFWGMTPKALLIYKEEKDRAEREKARMADISAWMVPSYAYENFCEMYKAYHRLGGNGMITKMMHEIEELHLKEKGD